MKAQKYKKFKVVIKEESANKVVKVCLVAQSRLIAEGDHAMFDRLAMKS